MSNPLSSARRSSSAPVVRSAPIRNPELPASLDRLARALFEVVGRVQRIGGVDGERLSAIVRDVLEGLSASAVVVVARSAETATVTPDEVRAWLHELRAPVTAIAGWAQMLSEGDDERRRRAVEAIERNGRLLSELLAQPPAA